MSDVDILSQITDLKEIDYKNTLLITSLIELLVENNIINKSELAKRIKTLDEYAVTFK